MLYISFLRPQFECIATGKPAVIMYTYCRRRRCCCCVRINHSM